MLEPCAMCGRPISVAAVACPRCRALAKCEVCGDRFVGLEPECGGCGHPRAIPNPAPSLGATPVGSPYVTGAQIAATSDEELPMSDATAWRIIGVSWLVFGGVLLVAAGKSGASMGQAVAVTALFFYALLTLISGAVRFFLSRFLVSFTTFATSVCLGTVSGLISSGVYWAAVNSMEMDLSSLESLVRKQMLLLLGTLVLSELFGAFVIWKRSFGESIKACLLLWVVYALGLYIMMDAISHTMRQFAVEAAFGG